MWESDFKFVHETKFRTVIKHNILKNTSYRRYLSASNKFPMIYVKVEYGNN